MLVLGPRDALAPLLVALALGLRARTRWLDKALSRASSGAGQGVRQHCARALSPSPNRLHQRKGSAALSESQGAGRRLNRRAGATVRTAVVVTHSGSGVPRYFGRGTQPASIFRTSSCTGPCEPPFRPLVQAYAEPSESQGRVRSRSHSTVRLHCTFERGAPRAAAGVSARPPWFGAAAAVPRGPTCAYKTAFRVSPRPRLPQDRTKGDRLPTARPPSPVLCVPELCKRCLQQLVLLHAAQAHRCTSAPVRQTSL